MIVTRHNHEIGFLKVNNYKFERVANFKYLGVNINENADSHEEIRLRLVAANKCYFGLVPLLKSKLLSWKTKNNIIQSSDKTSSTICLRRMGNNKDG